MEFSTDFKTGYDDLEVYMEYRYVFVSTTARNHAKMAYCLFNLTNKNIHIYRERTYIRL